MFPHFKLFVVIFHAHAHIPLYSLSTASGYRGWHPVMDGKVFADFPTKSILAGKFAKVPLIVGCVNPPA